MLIPTRAPIGLSLHIAFRVSVDDILGACHALRVAGVTPLSFFAPRPASRT
jgi:hypothetical protein